MIRFLPRSLPGSPDETPQRLSSSSLPPSFAAGRCAALYNASGEA